MSRPLQIWYLRASSLNLLAGSAFPLLCGREAGTGLAKRNSRRRRPGRGIQDGRRHPIGGVQRHLPDHLPFQSLGRRPGDGGGLWCPAPYCGMPSRGVLSLGVELFVFIEPGAEDAELWSCLAGSRGHRPTGHGAKLTGPCWNQQEFADAGCWRDAGAVAAPACETGQPGQAERRILASAAAPRTAEPRNARSGSGVGIPDEKGMDGAAYDACFSAVRVETFRQKCVDRKGGRPRVMPDLVACAAQACNFWQDAMRWPVTWQGTWSARLCCATPAQIP